MPVRGTKNPFPASPPRGDTMFAACKSGKGPHVGVLEYAKTVRQPVKPTRRPTKSLSR